MRRTPFQRPFCRDGFVVPGLALVLLLLAGAVPALASSAKKIDVLKLTPRSILQGVWEGNANVEKGKFEGQVLRWRLEFPDGDPEAATGNVIHEVVRVDARGLSLRRPFKMKIVYQPGPGVTYEVLTTSRLDETATKISGSFRNVMGTGSFELVKRNTAPPAARWKGDWEGRLTGSRGDLKKNPMELTVSAPTGQLEFARAKLGNLEGVGIVPSVWDETNRHAVFFLRYESGKNGSGGSRPRLVKIGGIFSESFDRFEGEFDGKKLGTGTLELARRGTTRSR